MRVTRLETHCWDLIFSAQDPDNEPHKASLAFSSKEIYWISPHANAVSHPLIWFHESKLLAFKIWEQILRTLHWNQFTFEFHVKICLIKLKRTDTDNNLDVGESGFINIPSVKYFISPNLKLDWFQVKRITCSDLNGNLDNTNQRRTV